MHAHRLASATVPGLAKTWHSQPEPWTYTYTYRTMRSMTRTKSDPGWFCTIDTGRLRKNATESKSGKLAAGRLRSARNRVQWFLHNGLLPIQVMRLAKALTGGPDQIKVNFSQYDPGFHWKNGTEWDAGSRVRHIRSGQILAARWP